MGKDWYVGLKVSKPLGGNTLSASYTEDETSEKHGQSSRTESVSQALELGLLDNLQNFSEKKSAIIALNKAKEEFQNTKDTILKEVEESYLNFKKALIQVDTSLNKIKYREEEFKITKARSELNEIPLSELIQAHVNLTDEKLFYIEALGNTHQSLAKLNKATGYALFLDKEGLRLANVKELR
jgi:outer membrane protein TolC